MSTFIMSVLLKTLRNTQHMHKKKFGMRAGESVGKPPSWTSKYACQMLCTKPSIHTLTAAYVMFFKMPPKIARAFWFSSDISANLLLFFVRSFCFVFYSNTSESYMTFVQRICIAWNLLDLQKLVSTLEHFY